MTHRTLQMLADEMTEIAMLISETADALKAEHGEDATLTNAAFDCVDTLNEALDTIQRALNAPGA